ncbi:MAG: hypothetical protein HOB20_15225, partial [Planctomycetaceae bacterium]|nr:hypothetical protein [Planctomycetaceae bacterium]
MCAGEPDASVRHSRSKDRGRGVNILFAISDDQSYPHASAYGTRGISTPGFDQVAREGVLIHNAIAG